MDQAQAQAMEEERRRQEEEAQRAAEEAQRQAEEAAKKAADQAAQQAAKQIAASQTQQANDRQARIEENRRAAEEAQRKAVADKYKNADPTTIPVADRGDYWSNRIHEQINPSESRTIPALERPQQITGPKEDLKLQYANRNGVSLEEAERAYEAGRGNAAFAAPSNFTPLDENGEERSRGAGNAADLETKMNRWLSPDYKMTREDRKEAQGIVRDFNRQYGSQGQLADPDQAERIAALDNKSRAFGSFNAGFMRPIMNATNAVQKGADWLLGGSAELGAGMIDDLAGTNLAGAVQNARNQINDAQDQNSAFLRDTYQNAQAQNNLAYQGGNLAGNAALYAATNPAFDSLGAAAGLGKVGGAVLNQVGQNAQDLALDTIPNYIANKEAGMSDEEAAREARNSVLMNAAGNAIVGGALPILGRGIDAIRGMRNSAGQAVESIAQDADNIARQIDPADLARQNAEGVDNILAQRQQAADQIAQLQRQIPEEPNPIPGMNTIDQVADQAARDAAEQEAQEAGEQMIRDAAERQQYIENQRGKYNEPTPEPVRPQGEESDLESSMQQSLIDAYRQSLDNNALAQRAAREEGDDALAGEIARSRNQIEERLDRLEHEQNPDINLDRSNDVLADYVNRQRKKTFENIDNPQNNPARQETLETVSQKQQDAADQYFLASDTLKSIESRIGKRFEEMTPADFEYDKARRLYNEMKSAEADYIELSNRANQLAEQKFNNASGETLPNSGTKAINEINENTQNVNSLVTPKNTQSKAVSDAMNLQPTEWEKLINEEGGFAGKGSLRKALTTADTELSDMTMDMAEKDIKDILSQTKYQGNPKLEEAAKEIEETWPMYRQAYKAGDRKEAKALSDRIQAAMKRFDYHASELRADDGALKREAIEGYESGSMNRYGLKKSVGTPAHYMKDLSDSDPFHMLQEVLAFDNKDDPEKIDLARTMWNDMMSEIEKRVDLTQPGAADAYYRLWDATMDQVTRGDNATRKEFAEAYDAFRAFMDSDVPEEKLDNLLKLDLQLFADKKEADDVLGQIKAGYRERNFAKNTRIGRVEGIPDEVKNQFVDQPEIYKVLSNAETKQKAQDIFDQGFDTARNQFDDLLNRRDPAAIPLGHSIAKELSAQGDYDGAAEVLRRMGEELTKSGQFSQAAAITMMKNDPLTALSYAEKQIDALNRQGVEKFGKRWKDFSLTDEERKLFNDIKPGDEEAIKGAFDQIGKRIGMEYPSTMMDKLLEARKISMLFNVRTNVRNAFANIPTAIMRSAADRFEAVGQNVAHIINPDIKVTQSMRGSLGNGGKIAREVYKSPKIQTMLDGKAGKYEVPSLKSDIKANTTVFKGNAIEHWIDDMTNGGIQKVNEKLFGKTGTRSGMETLRNLTYKMLDLGDKPFVKANFVSRLGSYINAQGIKSVEDVPDEAIQLAWEEAMKATYKDDSWAVQMLQGIRNNGIGKIPGVGRPLSQAAIPFVQAPGNIAARMVDYSPIRGTKGISDVIKGAKKNDADLVKRGIEEMSKGLTGTAAVLAGMRLYKSGVLTGAYSEDRDAKQFEKQTGKREFAVHVGDKYLTYDWAQPAAFPLLVGTLLQQAIDNSDQYDSDVLKALGHEGTTAGKVIGGVKAGASATVNSWFNASPLQGLQELMGGGDYGKDGIAANIESVVDSFGQSFVPAALGATAKSMDPVQRNTYDPTNKVMTQVNQIVSKIPRLSETLPAKYDTWGREVKTGETQKEAFAARFVIPGDYAYDNLTDIDKEIKRLYDDTKKVDVFPQVAPYQVGDQKLNNRQVSEYQKDMGERSLKLAESFINSDTYKDMDDANRVEALKTLYGLSKTLTERDKFDKDPASNSQYNKYIGTFDEGGEKAVIKQISDDYVLSNIAKETGGEEAKVTDKMREIYAGKGEKAAREYSKAYYDIKPDDRSINVQDVLDYSKKNPDVSRATLNALMPKNATGSLTKENGQWVYKDKEGKTTKTGMTEAEHKAEEKLSQDLSSYGLDKKSAAATYAKAQQTIPSLTTKQFADTYKQIDSNSNQGITQKELVSYMNNAKLSKDEGAQIWSAYGSDSWKKSATYNNGQWSLSGGSSKKSSGSSGGTASSASYQKAVQAFGEGYTTSDYKNTKSAIDTDGNGKLKKAEVKAYMDAHPEQADQIWAAYSQKNWKR